ncbi:MAG: hypothetical protein OEV42_10870 [Deltaproteobacteria bacterium]|nr:hypothetical protein [Deltaproteobacteria bacterium]
MTATCWGMFPASPRGWPKGQRRKSALGGLTSSVSFLRIEMEMVGIRASSIALCISPTD